MDSESERVITHRDRQQAHADIDDAKGHRRSLPKMGMDREPAERVRTGYAPQINPVDNTVLRLRKTNNRNGSKASGSPTWSIVGVGANRMPDVKRIAQEANAQG
jgi:hypothetical protein